MEVMNKKTLTTNENSYEWSSSRATILELNNFGITCKKDS